MRGGLPLLTEEDSTAIALTAATLTYLRDVARDPRVSRVVIAGAVSMPVLAPLLFTTGICDIALRNRAHARTLPLRRVARDADVILDLLHGDPSLAELALDRPEGSVLTLCPPNSQFLAAPGLLRALAERPITPVELGIDTYRACALALAAATPPRRRLPDLLHDQTADAIARRRTPRPGSGSSPRPLHHLAV